MALPSNPKVKDIILGIKALESGKLDINSTTGAPNYHGMVYGIDTSGNQVMIPCARSDMAGDAIPRYDSGSKLYTYQVSGDNQYQVTNKAYVDGQDAKLARNNYIQLRLSSDVSISSSSDLQITNLRKAGDNIGDNTLIFDTTNYDKVTIGAGVSRVKITSIIEYQQVSDATRFGNIVKLNGSNWTNRGNYVGQASDLTGTTLSSSDRKVIVPNVFIAEVSQGDVITFWAKSTGATSSSKDKMVYAEAQTHFIIEVIK